MKKGIRKPSILRMLITFDVSMIAVIFVLLMIFFNTTVSKLITDTAAESMKARSLRISQSLIEAYDYVARKPEMKTDLIMQRIHVNIVGHALNELEYSESLAVMIFDDGLVNGGTRLERDRIFDGSVLSDFSEPDGNYGPVDSDLLEEYLADSENKTSLMRFKFDGADYIGTVQCVDYEDAAVLLVLGDRVGDFYSRLYNIRNIFLIFVGISLILILFIKILNTRAAAAEILQIRNRMQEQGDAIQRDGIVENAAEPNIYEFLDTEDLAGSFYYLNGRIVNLGGVIEGIADRDLFRAALRDDESVLSPHEENMAILFLDVQGFTGISEQYGSAAMNIINRIWDLVQAAVEERGGKLNKFMGDACLVIFPESGNDEAPPSKRAIESAVTLYCEVEQLRRELQTDFAFRIGLDYGTVVYGKTGSERKYELGVIGDPVNTAARFESLNKQYGTRLLLSGEILENAGIGTDGEMFTPVCKDFRLFRIDRARPKGKKKPKEIYSLLSRNGADDKLCLIGLEQGHDIRLLKLHNEFLNACERKISLWRDEDTAAARRVWGGLAYNWALMDSKYGFSVAGMFVERFVTAENYLAYRRAPGDWMEARKIRVSAPDDSWLDTGYYELKK